MYQREITVQKGVKNQVRVQFKNSDQKRISISTSTTYMFSMFDVVNQRQLLEKPLEVLDDGVTTSTRGVAVLTLTESETIDLERSSYKFAIRAVDTDGSYVPTYANTYYSMAGTLHLNQDAWPVLQPSQSIEDFQKSFNSHINLYEFKSRAIYAYPEFNGAGTGLHTVAFYMTGYKGKVYVKATLTNDPDDMVAYADIKTLTYNGFTGVDYVNFNGVFSYIQVWYVPDLGPLESNNDTNFNYRGTFDKILYRC